MRVAIMVAVNQIADVPNSENRKLPNPKRNE
jgi:hypothetical protein